MIECGWLVFSFTANGENYKMFERVNIFWSVQVWIGDFTNFRVILLQWKKNNKEMKNSNTKLMKQNSWVSLTCDSGPIAALVDLLREREKHNHWSLTALEFVWINILYLSNWITIFILNRFQWAREKILQLHSSWKKIFWIGASSDMQSWVGKIRNTTHCQSNWGKVKQQHVDVVAFHFALKRYSHCVRLFFTALVIYSRCCCWFFSCTIWARENTETQNDTNSTSQYTIQRYTQHCDREKHFRNCNLKNFGRLCVCVCARACEWIAICANRIYSWTVVRSDRWNLICADRLKRDKDAKCTQRYGPKGERKYCIGKNIHTKKDHIQFGNECVFFVCVR